MTTTTTTTDSPSTSNSNSDSVHPLLLPSSSVSTSNGDLDSNSNSTFHHPLTSTDLPILPSGLDSNLDERLPTPLPSLPKLPPFNDVTKSNLGGLQLLIKHLLNQADFVSLDCEFTGLKGQGTRSSYVLISPDSV